MSLGLETSRDSIFEVLVLKGQCLGLGLGHLGFVTTPHAPNADLWAEVAKNDAFKSLHPLFEKIFPRLQRQHQLNAYSVTAGC